MPENTLKTVIDTETEIQAILDAERLRAQAWLERIRQEVDAELQAQLATLSATAAEAEQGARTAAAEETAVAIRQAELLAQRLAAISDDELERTVRRHLAVIIQGTGHDRPDGQG